MVPFTETNKTIELITFGSVIYYVATLSLFNTNVGLIYT